MEVLCKIFELICQFHGNYDFITFYNSRGTIDIMKLFLRDQTLSHLEKNLQQSMTKNYFCTN